MENSPKTPESNSKEQDYQFRGVALEANQLHGKELPPERIGHVLMSNEADRQAKNQTSAAEIDRQRVATMSRSELLEISSGINIDNTSLHHIYETHLVGENGLRRLVYEHMRGGNLKEALRHEILEHETEFERDPQLRRQSPFKLNGAVPKPGNDQPSLNDLLSKAGLVKLDPGKELTAPKILPERIARRAGLQPSQRRLLDLAFIGVILFLLILVTVLAISRG